MQEFGLQRLFDTLPQQGCVDWIGVRSGRREPMQTVPSVELKPGFGLTGDRFKGRLGSKRQVTLIQTEHIQAIVDFLHRPELDLSLLRRNILVSGINLLALKGKQILRWLSHVRIFRFVPSMFTNGGSSRGGWLQRS